MEAKELKDLVNRIDFVSKRMRFIEKEAIKQNIDPLQRKVYSLEWKVLFTEIVELRNNLNVEMEEWLG